jgi:prephenate dehydrogenase
MPIRQITIIGVGLIGGSFALALKKHGFTGRIVASDREPVLARAQELGAIDSAVVDPVLACRESEVVLLATPVSAIIDLMERVGPVLPAGALLTDTGSTKRAITDRARAVFGNAAPERFIPGHPITGKEHGGIDRADPDLFRGTPWVFCEGPSASTQPFIDLAKSVGASPVFVSAEQHDRVLARTSHLPQLIATALASQLDDELSPKNVATLAGRALREMTRIADSPYEIWRDIAITNADEIERALLAFEQKLALLRENLRTRELREEFERAARFRSSLRETNPDK